MPLSGSFALDDNHKNSSASIPGGDSLIKASYSSTKHTLTVGTSLNKCKPGWLLINETHYHNIYYYAPKLVYRVIEWDLELDEDVSIITTKKTCKKPVPPPSWPPAKGRKMVTIILLTCPTRSLDDKRMHERIVINNRLVLCPGIESGEWLMDLVQRNINK